MANHVVSTSLQERLAHYKQEHLLSFVSELSPAERSEYLDELAQLNLKEITGYFERTISTMNEDEEKLDDRLQPVPNDIFGSVAKTPKDTLKYYETIGLDAISKGHVGVLLLAGGQGTRLGVSYPKGMYDVGLPSRKTLYQLQAERIRKIEMLSTSAAPGSNGNITWYIMTSEHTKEPTLEFFASHNYFGLKKENLVVFEQGMLPCFTFDGKIIMDAKSKIAKAPDGNGGLYRALREKKILEDIDRRGIQYLHVYCVDNILVKMADPVFLGYCITKDAECGFKVVEKTNPTEPVGVVCKVDGKFKVVEYSEITLKAAQKRNPDGRLTFSAGNICNHFFTAQFLRNIINEEDSTLKHHVAKKKIATINQNGEHFQPSKPNGIKMEKFVFDVIQLSKCFVVWEVIRDEEFSPLKNGDGAVKDTPTTARQDLYNLHERYIREAGGLFSSSGLTNGEKHNGITNGGTHNGTQNGTDITIGKTNGSCNGTNGISNGCYPHDTNGINGQAKAAQKLDKQACEISPLVSYAGEGLTDLVQGKMLHYPLLLSASNETKFCEI